MAKAKVFETSDGGKSVWIECPGCGIVHAFKVGGPTQPKWDWNGSIDKPTFNPSMLVNKDHPESRCHSFVRHGLIQFLPDCHHELKNSTVELPDIDL